MKPAGSHIPRMTREVLKKLIISFSTILEVWRDASSVGQHVIAAVGRLALNLDTLMNEAIAFGSDGGLVTLDYSLILVRVPRQATFI